MKFMVIMRLIRCAATTFLAAYVVLTPMALSAAANDMEENAISRYTGEKIRIRYCVDEQAGTVSVRAEGTENRLNYLLANGESSYAYNAMPGHTAVLPLNMGNGIYTLSVRLFIIDNQAEEIWTGALRAELEYKAAPFLSSSDMVCWNSDMELARKAVLLAAGKTQSEAALAICKYISENFKYNNIIPAPGYIPDPEAVYASKKGICFDLSVIMAAMCRSAGIPCMLVMGNSEYMSLTKYHAWCLVLIDGNWKMIDPTYSLGGSAAFLDTAKTVIERIY